MRCPYGRPAVIAQAAYLADGEPFPTTYYLTARTRSPRSTRLEAAGGVDRYEQLVVGRLRGDGRVPAGGRPPARAAPAGGADGRRRRKPRGSGSPARARDGAVKCLHAHAAFALAEPGYALGRRILEEAAPLYPAGECCTRMTAAVEVAMLEWAEGERRLADAQPDDARRRAVVERVAAEIEAELVRRMGQTFDLAELTESLLRERRRGASTSPSGHARALGARPLARPARRLRPRRPKRRRLPPGG